MKILKKKPVKKVMIIKSISDMEMGGVYFPEIKKDYTDNICHYSGLPSVLCYGE
jgi:hypothetical protein